ncbi:hypothetical protein J8273_0687 [Carpediemonas membranifera]|uniref:Uncharacterized protein n=1 Tax=Carpediemonas membranifera TaxID=201153 RepID=A0A8J6BHG5_9EUKA|nr:hypothetical protein J8273_0687 [Carpediemonas membranifera]|eukprot:KAG9397557.1 hypothetical protein J8273_0687 [Carpediemonas membranifera]
MRLAEASFIFLWILFVCVIWTVSPYAKHPSFGPVPTTLNIPLPICNSANALPFHVASGAEIPVGPPELKLSVSISLYSSSEDTPECVHAPATPPVTAADFIALNRATMDDLRLRGVEPMLNLFPRHLVLVGDPPDSLVEKLLTFDPAVHITNVPITDRIIEEARTGSVRPASLDVLDRPIVPTDHALRTVVFAPLEFPNSATGSVLHSKDFTVVYTKSLRRLATLASLVIFDSPSPPQAPVTDHLIAKAAQIMLALHTLPVSHMAGVDWAQSIQSSLESAGDVGKWMTMRQAVETYDRVYQEIFMSFGAAEMSPTPPFTHHMALVGVMGLPPSVAVIRMVIKVSKSLRPRRKSERCDEADAVIDHLLDFAGEASIR